MTTATQDDAVILCGGLGTRLRAVVSDRPKPMALIGGRPFLDLIVDHLLSQGFTRMIFSTGHRGEWIADHVTRRRDIEAVISQEEDALGTGGALLASRPLLRTPTVLVLNGDSLCRADLHALLRMHHSRSAVATMAVVPANGRTDGGGVSLDERGRVLTFRERTTGAHMNAGIYAVQTDYLHQIRADSPCSLERDVIPGIVENGSLYAFPCNTPVYDIGTPGRLAEFRSLEHEHHREGVAKGTAC